MVSYSYFTVHINGSSPDSIPEKLYPDPKPEDEFKNRTRVKTWLHQTYPVGSPEVALQVIYNSLLREDYATFLRFTSKAWLKLTEDDNQDPKVVFKSFSQLCKEQYKDDSPIYWNDPWTVYAGDRSKTEITFTLELAGKRCLLRYMYIYKSTP